MTAGAPKTAAAQAPSRPLTELDLLRAQRNQANAQLADIDVELMLARQRNVELEAAGEAKDKRIAELEAALAAAPARQKQA